ncbi:MAG: hypothetical protein K6U08_05275 [Firmicutes bacterium]|nr:hypothetical protein [Bacillota bacterium]
MPRVLGALGLAVLVAWLGVGCAGCRGSQPPPSGPVTEGFPEPLPARQDSGTRALAVGPFVNLRDAGWLEDGRAWGWGDLDDERQVFFTVTPEGAVRTTEIPAGAQLASALPLRDGGGCVGVHYADFTAWVHPVDGQPIPLGAASALSLSPHGRYLLRSDREAVSCLDTTSWASTPLPGIPHLEFPYSFCHVAWLDDTLLAVRLAGAEPYPGALRAVRLPDGAVLAEMREPGAHLAPVPAPGGAWLAVVVIRSSEAVYLEEAAFPETAGSELRIYSRESLAAGAGAGSAMPPEPAVVLRAADGKVFRRVLWSPDGSRLAYVESPAPSGPPGAGPAQSAEECTFVAGAPGFAPVPVTLPSGGPWYPRSFSPDGSYLALVPGRTTAGEPEAAGLAVWDVAAVREVPVPDGLRDSWDPVWLGRELLLAVAPDEGGHPTRLRLWRLGGEDALNPRWPDGARRVVAGAQWVALVVAPEEPATVEPFGRLRGGDWLLLYEAPGD